MIRRALRVVLPLAVVVAGAIGAWSMIENRPQPETRLAEAPLPLVRVVEAEPRSARMTRVSGFP